MNAVGNALWVLPAYRNSQAGRTLLEYAIAEIDRLGLELLIEGTYISTPLYLQYGFTVVGYVNFVFDHHSSSAEWKRLVRDLQAHPISLLWRPPHGRMLASMKMPQLPASDMRMLAKL